MSSLLADWSEDPIELEVMLVILACGIVLSGVFAFTYSSRVLRELPRGLGVLAMLLGTFGFALELQIEFLRSHGLKDPGASLFTWGAILCTTGFLVTWMLEWWAGRNS